jgi:hypothetical protein
MRKGKTGERRNGRKILSSINRSINFMNGLKYEIEGSEGGRETKEKEMRT